MTDRALKKQKERLNFYKELLEPWLPFPHFSEEEARELQGRSASEVRAHFLEHMCGCKPNSLKTAAQFFGVDASSEADCLILAAILAQVLFGERKVGRKRGHTTAWTGAKLILLARTYRELKAKNPDCSDAQIAEKISAGREFSEYKNNPTAIQKKLREAKAELFHMECNPGEYYHWLRVSGEGSVVGEIRRRGSKRSI
jgi:hypothetical protein